ncbi:MAG TPA: glycerol-3-phosphate dehydrogenase, partial [Burkholderiaceae bacterium]|nr:glycerol-3-phosphate dehydrogenase [Burkholderiaceae bacterium]
MGNLSKVSILGAGAWGTAVAIALAARHDVLLWGRHPEAMAAIDAARENAHYLPGQILPANLRVCGDFEEALAHAGSDGLLIAATPV